MDGLLEFIAKAHKQTYAAPDEIREQYRCAVPLLQGHKEFEYTDGDWRYHDSYAGQFWAPGSEVVLYKGKPVWRMSYQGKRNDALPVEFYEQEVFPFLKRALMAASERRPFRGLDGFREGLLRYNFEMDGSDDYFHGREEIILIEKKGYQKLFYQHVMGSIIR